MAEDRELSLRLNAVLDMVGTSEKIRNMHHRAATSKGIIGAYLRKQITKYTFNIHTCGSNFEGTLSPDLMSDVDIIVCPSEPLVVRHRLLAGAGLCLLAVSEAWTRPGYAKLQCMVDGRPLYVSDVEPIKELGFDTEGRACVKHYAHGNMHGPAEMFVDEDGRHCADRVLAFHCRSIPLYAREWITRQRRHDWPSQQLIDELKKMGCLFVGAGHFNSPERDLEWRLSFSLQEKLLMKNLNDTQHKVYVLLKMIKKNIIEVCFPVESLSSYHFKTCVFYMAETTPRDMWVPENLLSCLMQCISLLLKWVKDQFCPSFFLKDSNLFDKEDLSSCMNHLEQTINTLLNMEFRFLNMIQTDRVGEILQSGDLSVFKPLADKKIGLYIVKDKLSLISALAFVNTVNADQDSLSLYMTELEELEQGDHCFPGYTQEETRAALRLRIPRLHLSIGLEYAARAVTCPGSASDKDELLKKSEHHMQQAGDVDLMSVRLVQASILLSLDKVDECLQLLQELQNDWTSRVSTFCPCTGREARMLIHPDMYVIWKDTSVKEIMKSFIASCVIFERSQIDLVPPPLRYEMYRSLCTEPGSRDEKKEAWFDRAAVDVTVYFYLLQYLVWSKLDDDAPRRGVVNELDSLVNNDRGDLYHRETAFNILGWMFLQENHVEDAAMCFKQSWEILPHHNAAKFHVLEMLLHRSTGKQQAE